MNRKLFKKLFWVSGSVLALLTLVLAVHIYIVTRPKAPDAHTLVMARLDVQQDINQEDANNITTWLYQQKGVDHVLVNPATNIVVFTYHPTLVNANVLAQSFNQHFTYQAKRFMPSKEALSSGCPVAATSFSYKAYHLLANLF